jgi:hypothetical protein
MWKMHTSKIVSNKAQDVLCRRKTRMESTTITYVVVRQVSAAGDKREDITIRIVYLS